MALKEYKPEKLLYTMGEVTEMFDVKPSLIRFWEQRFDILKPKKNKKGNRLFTPADVKNLEIIYHLTKERGMTLAGVEKYLRNNREDAQRETEIVRRLQNIRSVLVEIREELREDVPGEVNVFVCPASAEAEITASEPNRTSAETGDLEKSEPGVASKGEIKVEPEPETIEETPLEGFSDEVDSFGAGEETQTLYEQYPAEPVTATEIAVETEQSAEADQREIVEDTEEEVSIPVETWWEEPEDPVIDEEVSVPFTAQPLFELEEPADPAAEETPESRQPEEEIKPSALDTQQSLF